MGEEKCGREGEAGEIRTGCMQRWGPFQTGARQGGLREEIRPVVKRFYKWHGEFEKRNSFSNPVEALIHRFGFFGHGSLGG
jgi:hypothetical protein